ncbi:MAG: peptide chain release factor N(5)-glutamine methyltransferase [Candidatus Omnitrophica bacterium]|nr:peptide chain release factor N(5)-glutamine methyltransferase [Candidatus Omnitrophota bacterium]
MQLTEWIGKSKNIFTHSDLQFLLRQFFCDKDIFLKQKNIFLDAARLRNLEAIKKEYKSGMPLAYILGKEEFFGLEFNVNSSVLIPRQDTEVIIEKAIEIIKNNDLTTVLDLCCGSANIAITIKKFFKDKIKVWASDTSEKAIETAKSNVKFHKVKIDLRKGSLFAPFRSRKFDIIVSNPPYVASREIKGSLKYEPRIALKAGLDGLYFIEKIIKSAHLYLKRNGFLVIEAGCRHKKPINSILEKTGKYEIIECIYDYGKNFRGIVLRVHR